jgi:hypothetical protein
MKIGTAVTAVLIAAFPFAGNAAAPCDEHAFGVLIDQTAQTLRTLNRDSEARFQERLAALAKTKGWSEAQKADKAAAAMDDSKLESFNAEIEELVGRLDALNATPKSEMSCPRLSDIKSVNDKLVGVMRRKAGFILAQLEAEGARAPIAPYAQIPPAAQTVSATPPPSQAAPLEKSGKLPQTASAVVEPAPAPAPAQAPGVAWSANVAKALRPPAPPAAQQANAAPPAPAAAPLPLRPTPPQPAPGGKIASLTPPPNEPTPPPSANGYSPDEIRNAGEGVFGKLTGEFAVVMNHAFDKYGAPNAYIVGDEGGGAFLAGLRYGEGQLHSRLNGVQAGPTPIYWQGPSLGADIGATGSRALFLVYNLSDAQGLYRRFPGIDGAAYVAGGFGLTLYRSGNLLIMPIRSGIGLRLGASLAYLKFTERASWNPF